MKIPNNWKYIKKRETDFILGEIALDKKDTLQFYYGKNLNNFEANKGFYIINDSVFLYQENEDKVNRYKDKFYGKADTVNFKNLSNTKSSFEVINNINAQITIPKKVGTGLTWVYFKKIKTKEKNVSFLISGFNLSEENQQAFLKSIRTIKFKK
ncbi:hypothetical protein [Flavobacterium dankookense]|nr:hypothetical protein [Flavobacterium dankookense]